MNTIYNLNMKRYFVPIFNKLKREIKPNSSNVRERFHNYIELPGWHSVFTI